MPSMKEVKGTFDLILDWYSIKLLQQLEWVVSHTKDDMGWGIALDCQSHGIDRLPFTYEESTMVFCPSFCQPC